MNDEIEKEFLDEMPKVLSSIFSSLHVRPNHIPESSMVIILELTRKGYYRPRIAKEAKCSARTVYEYQRMFEEEGLL